MKDQRAYRACDRCRALKIRCYDYNPCSVCADLEIPCSYTVAPKKRGPPSNRTDRTEQSSISNRSQRCSNYNSAQIVDLVKSDAHFIQVESVLSDLGSWTPERFPPVEIDGVIVQWLDAYFQYVHPRYPVLCESFVRQNYAKLPLFLLHAMYAFTLSLSTKLDSTHSLGDYHYTQCKLHFENSHDNTNPWSIFATLLMAIYAITNTTAVVGGISWLAVAVRYAQTLGIFQLADIKWRTEDGFELGNQTGTSKRYLQMLVLHLYECDFMTSFIRKLPPLLTEKLNPEWCVYIPRDDPYNSFYESKQWCYSFRLLEISMKVILFVRYTPIDISNPQWHQQVNELDQQLQTWYTHLPTWMQKNTAGFSFDPESQDPPPFYIGYYISIYHTMRIFLQKSMFLSALELGEYDHCAITICRHSASQITTTYNSFIPLKESLAQVSLFSYYPVFMAGAIHCMLLRIHRTQQLNDAIDSSINILRFSSQYVPILERRVESLWTFRDDPIQGAMLFGKLT